MLQIEIMRFQLRCYWV